MVNIKHITTYDMVSNPSFGSASFRKPVSFEAINYYAKKFCVNDKLLIKYNTTYKMNFIKSIIDFERTKKEREGFMLDVLIVEQNQMMLKQTEEDIFGLFTFGEIMHPSTKNYLELDNCCIDYTTKQMAPRFLHGRDKPDIIIYSGNKIDDFYDRYYNVFTEKRRNGKAMVKLVYLFDYGEEIDNLIDEGFYYHELNSITDEDYKKDLREDKLKRILKNN